jgi:hypothetical protein
MAEATIVTATMLPALGQLCSAASTPSQIFDAILTQEFIAAVCKTAGVSDFSFHVDTSGVTRFYGVSYRPRSYALASDDYYVLTVHVAPAGTFLTAAKYKERLDEFRRQFSDRGPEFFRWQFPPVGSRAMQELHGFGPGGASFGWVFTTKDELFDVRVSMANLLSEGIPDPDCDPLELTHRTEARYESAK